jgi:imidazolonepropionase
MATRGVVAVLLPAAAFSLMMSRYADARLMIDCGVPVALGTDYNPSCLNENMQLVIAFACHFMKLTSAEAIVAATINAAHALGRANDVGSLEVGKRADVVILDVPNHKFLGYHFGVNSVDRVIKNGRIVVDNEANPGRIVHLED